MRLRSSDSRDRRKQGRRREGRGGRRRNAACWRRCGGETRRGHRSGKGRRSKEINLTMKKPGLVLVQVQLVTEELDDEFALW